MEFKIVSIARVDSSTVRVDVKMDAKDWNQAKIKDYLGHLYGTCISNEVNSYGVKGIEPTVDHSARASKGVKFITLFYKDSEWTPAPDNVIKVDFINKRRAA